MSKTEPKTELARGFTIADYLELRPRLDPDIPETDEWERVLAAFRTRIEERFLEAIPDLARHDNLPDAERPIVAGFAILTLDCLIIDALQSFREGRISTGDKTTASSFRNFLRRQRFSSSLSKSDCYLFYRDVRNGLLHNGETRGNWKIRFGLGTMLVKDLTTGTRTIDRHVFHKAIVDEFDEFFQALH